VLSRPRDTLRAAADSFVVQVRLPEFISGLPVFVFETGISCNLQSALVCRSSGVRARAQLPQARRKLAALTLRDELNRPSLPH
jgi:hypothetical protein